ncbi:hypothetical protein QU873_27785, partial [Escherichia coli]|uniref:hypothetical protein n=2 Tax=Escherichia coli TaxID=562 RepID=UPI00112F95FD
SSFINLIMPGILLCIICALNLSSRKRLALKSLNYKHIQLCKGGYNKPDYFNVCIPALLISQNNKNPG